MRSLCILGLVSVTAACGRTSNDAAVPSSPDQPVWYDLFNEGDAVTDQGSTRGGPKSNLVGTFDENDSSVPDDLFAAQIATPAIRSGASFFYSFGQCYSGGFIDDLAKLGGNQAMVASARHTETASYGYEPPEGVDVDYTDAFIQGLADGKATAEAVIRHTAAVDPFGPNPDTPRVSEPQGSEHTQYFATGLGADIKVADHAATGMAVLWAGEPAERDGKQMNLMIDRLVAMGYARDRIWLLYGGGQADGSHPIVQAHIIDKQEPVHLLAATKANLVELFNRTFGSAAEGAKPDFVFFYVGDHGGLDGEATAKLNFGKPDALVTPVLVPAPGAQLYGEGK